MDRFKMQAASEVGVNLTNGYNGHLTSREAGSVGGQMVNIMTPVRTLKFERNNRISQGHKATVQYSYFLIYNHRDIGTARFAHLLYVIKVFMFTNRSYIVPAGLQI